MFGKTIKRVPDKSRMKISVVLANYNHARYLKSNIEGFLAQTYPHWELHIVDDGSTDGSVDLIKEYAAKDARIRPIYCPQNQGALKAVDLGLAVADGELLYNSAADDYVVNPRFFALAAEALARRPAAGFFGKASVVDSETLAEKWVMGSAPQKGFVPPQNALVAFLHSRLFVPGVSAIWRRSLVDPCGGFDAALGPQVDYYLNHALPALAGVVFGDEVMAVCRVVEGSYSASATDEDFFRRHALVEKKIKALNLPYAYKTEWFRIWRENIINARLAVTRQSGFIQAMRGQLKDIQPWETASLPERFTRCTAHMLEECNHLETELAAKLARARGTFDEVAGRLG